MGTPLATAFVRVRPDTSGFQRETERDASQAGDKAGNSFGNSFSRTLGSKASGLFASFRKTAETSTDGAGAAAGRKFGDDFVRDAAGRLRDARGRFITEGSQSGSGFGDAFVRDATGRLRDGRGRFVTEGGQSGSGFARAFTPGIGAASSSMSGLISVGVALGPAIIPVAAAAAAAIGGIGVAATAAFAGLGVGILAFVGISDAVKAMGAAQDEAAKHGAALSRSHSAVASAADGVRNAEQSLARTREQVADSNEQSARRVSDAEADLTRAQQEARDVALELNEARQEARERLDDLTSSVQQNALSQRQSNLDVAKAKADLDKVLTNPLATKAQREQAKITYEREVLQLSDLKRRGKELADDQKQATRQGVEGSREVLAVRKRMADADDRVKDAQQSVTDARRQQQKQERDGAYQVRAAQQALVAAQRSLRDATVASGVAGAAAMAKLKKSMESLSPAGQKFAKFIFGLKDEARSLRDAAQAGLLPGVQEAIERLLPYLPQVRKFVGDVARTMGDLAVKAADAFTSPQWKAFFQLIADTAGPALRGMFDASMNIALGFANIMRAFSPLNKDLGTGIVGLTKKFADWTAQLSTSEGFKRFIDYVRTNGPRVLELVGNIAQVAGNLVVGLAPLGAGSLGGLILLTGQLAKLSPETLAKIGVGIAAMSAAVTVYNVAAKTAAFATTAWAVATKVASVAQKVWTGVQWAFNAAMAANPVGLIVVALIALAAGLVIAYKKSDAFRAIVQKAWAGIQSAVSYAWEKVIRPALTSLADFFTNTIAPAAMWLWNSVFKPVFAGISSAISFAWNAVILPVLAGWKFWFTQVIGPAVLWLWREVVQPAWQGIQLAISVAWAAIQIVFGLAQIWLKILGAGFMFFWRGVIVPAWNGIMAATGLWWASVKLVFNAAVGFVRGTLAPVFMWFLHKVIRPVFAAIYATIRTVWETNIKPIFNVLGGFLAKHVVPAFKLGVSAIGKAWEKIRDVAKIPVKFIVETVINQGIIGTYNKIAKVFGVDKVEPIKLEGFARGGVLPGYTPGKDVHRFVSASGGAIDLSGGEAIIRPEGTRALGKGWVDGINQAARNGGVGGVQRFLGGFADGGVLGRLGKLASKAKNKATDVISGAVDFVTDPAGTLRKVADKVIGLVPGGNTGFGKLASEMPRRVTNMMLDRVKNFFGRGGEDGGNGINGTSPLGGSGGMMRILRATFPGLRLISGNRPGSRTLSGNRSYHSTNRAVDVPPIKAVAKHIFEKFRSVTRELITPYPEYNLHNGRPHRYTGAVWRQHNFAGGNAHDHWAARLGGIVPGMPARLFDTGGDWPSGTVGVNMSGRTEHVSTGGSMDKVVARLDQLISVGLTPPMQVHLHDGRATLAQVDALDRQRALRARFGRRR